MVNINLSKKKEKEKKDKTAFELHFTSQNFYPETILSSIIYKFPQKALFIFFSIYTILEKFESGTLQVDPYCPLKKMITFCQKHVWFELRCIF